MRSRLLPATAALSTILLAGCAGDMTGYPSLAPRKVESSANPAPATPAEPASAPTIVAPSGTAPALAKIIDDAGKADAAFQAALAKSRDTIAKGAKAPVGSEAWIVAQQAYSAVDTARTPIATALGDLDKLRQQAADKGEDQSAIIAASQQVQAIDEAERAALDGLDISGS